jgi:bacteriorhodopsin
MMELLRRKPWLWIVFAFLVLIAAWTVLITIAVNNQPEKIPLDVKGAGETAVEAAE